MKFDELYLRLKDIPFIARENAENLYQFIIDNGLCNILELGIAHGTSSCYIAGALDELGAGKLTCVDLLDVNYDPSAENQLDSLKLSKYVDIFRMKSGYNWFLRNEIKSQSDFTNHSCTPKYDLIIIDGPKNWTIDSSSFFLADKLLKKGGWIIWDDYDWTYEKANQSRDVTDGITHRNMSNEELVTPHIKEIFNLLVTQHQDYGNFIINEDSGWAWAQKISVDTKSLKFESSISFMTRLNRVVIRFLKQ